MHDVKEFIQPHQWHVQQLITHLEQQQPVTPFGLWDWVCRNVQYPLDSKGKPNEYHRLEAYAYRKLYRVGCGWMNQTRISQQVWDEWFDWPWEILAQPQRWADCDGSSILLCSLLRGIGQESYVAIGGFAGEDDPLTHAWVVTEGQVWEVTTSEAGLALEEENDYYIPLMYFNEREVWAAPEVWQALAEYDYVPALGQVFGTRGFIHDDCRKVCAIANLWGGIKSCSCSTSQPM